MIEVVRREGKPGWVIRRATVVQGYPWSRVSHAPHEYWNGSWSLSTFGDTYAKVYPSAGKAWADYLAGKLRE